VHRQIGFATCFQPAAVDIQFVMIPRRIPRRTSLMINLLYATMIYCCQDLLFLRHVVYIRHSSLSMLLIHRLFITLILLRSLTRSLALSELKKVTSRLPHSPSTRERMISQFISSGRMNRSLKHHLLEHFQCDLPRFEIIPAILGDRMPSPINSEI